MEKTRQRGMSKGDLLKYVKGIYELEKSVYMQDSFLEMLYAQQEKLTSWSPESLLDIITKSGGDQRLNNIRQEASSKYDVEGTGECIAVLSMPVIFILTIICSVKYDLLGVIAAPWLVNAFVGGIIGVFVAGVGGLIFNFIWEYIISGIIITPKIKRKENIIIKQKVDSVNAGIIQKNEIQEKEVTRRLESLNAQIEESEDSLEDTEDILSDFYDKDIIYKKYRNLYAISSICEYLESGRCEKLTGANGAYNLYESELRQGIIINQLDEIISELDEIKQNQWRLYEAIMETKKTVERLSNVTTNAIGKLEQLKDNTEICAYNSQIVAQNEIYQSLLMTYAYIEG